MADLLDLVREHYQWVFGGIGATLVTAVGGWLFRRRVAQPGPGSVFSVNQSGGVTAGTYVNQAPKPQLKAINSQRTRNPDGTHTTTALVEVVSPYPPANLYVQANAAGILDFDCISQRPGVHFDGPSGKRPGYCFTNVKSPFGKYMIKVRTQEPAHVALQYDFNT